MIRITTISVFVALLGSIGITPQAQASEACRNTQIVYYLPKSGSSVQKDLQYIQYWVSPDVEISSLEAFINGESKPVQYRELDGGAYRARVVVPQNIEGSVYVDIGAASAEAGTCNNLLSFTFVLDSEDSHDKYGVLRQAKNSLLAQKLAQQIADTKATTLAQKLAQQIADTKATAITQATSTVAESGIQNSKDYTEESDHSQPKQEYSKDKHKEKNKHVRKSKRNNPHIWLWLLAIGGSLAFLFWVIKKARRI